ncbi:unnamed protein product [Mucor hiemalis]
MVIGSKNIFCLMQDKKLAYFNVEIFPYLYFHQTSRVFRGYHGPMTDEEEEEEEEVVEEVRRGVRREVSGEEVEEEEMRERDARRQKRPKRSLSRSPSPNGVRKATVSPSPHLRRSYINHGASAKVSGICQEPQEK